MNLLIKYPTRNRKDVFFKTFDLYYNKLSGKHNVEFVVSMDADDSSMNQSAVHSFLDSKKNVCYCYGENKGKVQAINANMQDRDFDVLLLASDDMIPVVDGYDDIICTKMQEHFPELDGCLHFNDGRARSELNTLSIMGKKMYEHFGYIYHPDYTSLWCDNEFHDVTVAMGKSAWVDQIIIRHDWVDATGQDSLHRHNESFHHKDKRVYEKRRAAGFPKASIGTIAEVKSRDPRRRQMGNGLRRRRP